MNLISKIFTYNDPVGEVMECNLCGALFLDYDVHEEWHSKDKHDHIYDESSQLKFNNGNPVFLCGYPGCGRILCYAEKDEVTGEWGTGRIYM